MIKKLTIIIGLLFISSSLATADISSDLGKFFDRLGYASNSSKGGSFSDQSAGYYTGGSLIARTRPRNVQLATIQMPGYKAGCGGIDVYTGGFSHIKASELVHAMKQIGANMGSFAFTLAVQTVSPQINNAVNYLNDLATKINAMSINSCEVGATLVGGLWPKSDMASAHICKSMGSSLGGFSDWASARQGCGVGGKRDNTLQSKDSHEGFKNILVGEFNLAWKALQNFSFLQKDKGLAEFFMSLSGTLISRKKEDGYELQTLPSLADNNDLLNALLDGGEATGYICDEDKEDRCLNPTKKSHIVSSESGLRSMVSKMLGDILSNIYSNSEHTKDQQNFVSSCQLPIYKILNIVAAHKRGGGGMDVQEYADIITLDIVYQYLMEIIDLIYENLNHLKGVQVDDAQIQRFQAGLYQARTRLIEKRSLGLQDLQTKLAVIQLTKLREQQVFAQFNLGEE